ncbi:MAG: hypothetical protein Q8N54_08625 [Sulfurimicrobium sp.]|nr:hypothetical protein [Sulfurimicrobium sp.]MDO9188866.1 hypothetical protein [Sulfurimicrobium sp.]MDP1705494.1 hypothetical protein [Sulfurimicrobium sp.]MDP2962811.1 hypothetical protein [Sulfurimicrobium sp.]MDP3687341.1 hypothetical protein [Sulfurimicrobium sp.]
MISNEEPIFTSSQDFGAVFSAGLEGLLMKGGLGPFILVCANATFDRRLYEASSAGLAQLYTTLRDEYVQALQQGREIQAVEEDLLVFLKIHAIGLDRLQPAVKRQAGIWELQFNHLRSFRPRRIASRVPEHLRAPFDEAGFHFNKGFMQKEAFWAGELLGRHATLYYNKYPFVDFHGLLVPERDSCLPQYLTEAHHFYLWEATAALAQTLDGVGFGYNSLGAFASVNHLHFQMFIKPEGFAVMAPTWRHNGGEMPYPATCLAFADPKSAWAGIHRLHESETPYNLLYSSGRMYLFPRRKQGTCPQPAWTSGFTWHELAGGIVVFNREDYDRLDAPSIEHELAILAP